MESTAKVDRKKRPQNPTSENVSEIGSPESTPGSRNQRSDSKHKNLKRKRRPFIKSQTRPNDIYISEKSSIRAQLDKCKKLLSDDNYQEIFLHGLGSAISRTLNVALELKDIHYRNTVDFETKTSTVKLIDDLVPQDDIAEPSYSTRNVSSLTVRLFRTVRLP
jgi:DNA-binding protein